MKYKFDRLPYSLKSSQLVWYYKCYQGQAIKTQIKSNNPSKQQNWNEQQYESDISDKDVHNSQQQMKNFDESVREDQEEDEIGGDGALFPFLIQSYIREERQRYHLINLFQWSDKEMKKGQKKEQEAKPRRARGRPRKIKIINDDLIVNSNLNSEEDPSESSDSSDEDSSS